MNKKNAVKSMTGFGEARFSDGSSEYRLCISSLNHKFLDISARLPDQMSSLEQRIKDSVRAAVKRGRISVVVEKSGGGEDVRITVNKRASEQYIKSLKELSGEFNLKGEINPVLLLNLPGAVTVERDYPSPVELRKKIEPALKKALAEFCGMRESEGANLSRAMQRSVDAAARRVSAVEKRAGVASRKKAAQLRAKLREASVNSSEGAFASEIVNLINRMDITEETVRLNSHVLQFNETLLKKPSGIKLEFILQEMQREANTMAAKSQDAVIARKVIEIKTELQKLKEQVQNIE